MLVPEILTVKVLVLDLKNMDISEFNIRSIPYTLYQQDLQELSVPPLELFLKKIIETNYYEAEYCDYASTVYNNYKLFCNSHGFEYIENVKAFGVRLKRLRIDGWVNERTRQGAYYIFNITKLKTFYKMDEETCFHAALVLKKGHALGKQIFKKVLKK